MTTLKVANRVDEISIIEDKDKNMYYPWNETANLHIEDSDGKPLWFDTKQSAIDYFVETSSLVTYIKSRRYTSGGVVLGNCWGGGQGIYPAREYESDSLTELRRTAEEDFKSGGLDSGFGFESLVAAVVEISCKETVCVDEVQYSTSILEYIELGKAEDVTTLRDMYSASFD